MSEAEIGTTRGEATAPARPAARGAAVPGIPRACRVAWTALAVAGLLAIGYGASRLLAQPDPAAASASAALPLLVDVGQALLRDIRRVVEPAVERTRKLAVSPEMIDALRSDDAARLTDVCNAAITGATEIDALAAFDRDGRIRALNTIYADGTRIEPGRVQRVLDRSFADREIIQSCARNGTLHAALEFQTGCDITPALFDSTGLSVAYSIPVFDPAGGERLGVLSTRLRFERLSTLIAARKIGKEAGAIQFVTDQGGYFSERINSGAAPPPVPPAVLARVVAPLVTGSSDQVMVRHGAAHLMLFRLQDFATLDGGGIQVMLRADDHWLAREAQLARIAEAGTAALIGVLLLLASAMLRAAATAARAGRVIAEQKRTLEAEMVERQRVEAERANLAQSLIEASRRAGMAEIATGVLHNVGNALNSVNVSAAVVQDRVRALKVDGLARASRLLRENGDDLPNYLSADDKGRRIPGYLLKLAENMAGEQGAICAELGTLAERIDHIKTIVSTQQEYSRAGGLIQEVSLTETLEAVLRIHATRATRHSVRIVRALADVGLIRTDKHRLAQILLNLVSNAFQAMRDVAEHERVLTLRTAADGERIRISVTDTGSGIAPENLTRIFSYGFTTRDDGHGFGLHSSANAAREMGGSLTATSDGPGQGATFTLELPLRREVDSVCAP